MSSPLTGDREPRPGDVVQSDPNAPSSAAGAQHPGTQSPTDSEGNAQPAEQSQLQDPSDQPAGEGSPGAGGQSDQGQGAGSGYGG